MLRIDFVPEDLTIIAENFHILVCGQLENNQTFLIRLILIPSNAGGNLIKKYERKKRAKFKAEPNPLT